jgi:MFS family permease
MFLKTGLGELLMDGIVANGRTVAERSRTGSATARYTLALLCVIGVVNYIDRQVLSVLLEDVKHDLGASDTQMGLLNGFVFASVYIIAGIPIAHIVDQGVRRNVLVVCLAGWSVATMLCGLTRNYWQLAAARMGVAAGEAGASPSSQSLIASLFPLESRGRALGFWSASNSAGIGIGLMLGGFLSHYLSWRGVFIVVGLPGLALAMLTFLTVREPPHAQTDVAVPSFRVAARSLWSIPSYRWAILITAFASFCGSGLFGWLPSFLIRMHGMTKPEVGAWSGTAAVGALVLSHMLAGWLADRWGRRDARAYFHIAGCSTLATAPLVIAFSFVQSQEAAITLFFLLKLALGLYMVPMYTVVLSLAPATMRGLAGFSMAIAVNLAGAGLGPFFVGAMNDILAPQFGAESIRYSMALLMLPLFLAVFAATRGSRYARADFARADVEPRH